MITDTQELLANFVEKGSESAFRELVTRYFDLVYSTAVRLVDGDTHRAQDVAQIVFADLARMARKLSASTTLGGWLHRHTCFVARTAMRGERRRQARERQAAEMNSLNDPGESVLTRVAPILDEAITELGADDRDAILLRFFERRNLRSVGEALGITENVAQKRVARALGELAILLQRRGVTLSAAALASGLAAGAVKAAPAGLALGIAGIVLGNAEATGGISLASAKVAGIAKLNIGLAGAILILGIATVIFLNNPSKARLPDNSLPANQQSDQADAAASRSVRTADPDIVPSLPKDQLPPARTEAVQKKPSIGFVGQPSNQSVTTPEKTAVKTEILIGQFLSRPGSKIRIKGTSNIHDWQAESKIIAGFLEIGPGFPADPTQILPPGPVQARGEASTMVHALQSVEKDGRHYSDKMDEIMWETLKGQENPKIHYRLMGMSLKETTDNKGALQYEFESQGELAIAGITNQMSMPLLVLPLGDGKLKISGGISLKMTSFQIDLPSLGSALGIKVGDEVAVEFEWMVAAKSFSVSTQKEMVPLRLKLPQPAFKGTPKDLQLSTYVEPLSDKPRPPLMVPPGLKNIARGAKLTSSDKNATESVLEKITDADKEASDRSIIFLRKGTQWVQMDLGSEQEVYAVIIWHAHNTAKVFHDVIVQVSDDPDFLKNVKTIFNNDQDKSSGLGMGTDREYFETYEGKLINAKGVIGRYLRFYSKGSTESALNEYTEIEVYGRQPW